eukprot:9104137-Pyramimonas_sp.AAC.1
MHLSSYGSRASSDDEPRAVGQNLRHAHLLCLLPHQLRAASRSSTATTGNVQSIPRPSCMVIELCACSAAASCAGHCAFSSCRTPASTWCAARRVAARLTPSPSLFRWCRSCCGGSSNGIAGP